MTISDDKPNRLIKLERLSKVYADNCIFSGVTAEVLRGEFICIVGSSGSGKTTLLRCLLGVEKVSSGLIYQADELKFSYVPQQPTLLPWKNTIDNVISGLVDNVADGIGRARKMLEIVGLTGKDKLLPRQLSGGMQQRVSFARALVSEPDIVFMDEPFSALDEMRRTELGRLVFDLWNNSGITFIMNTHSVEDACMLSSKVWIMAAGQRGNGSRLQVINTWMKGESLEFRKSSNRVGIVRDLVVRGMAVSAA